MASRYTKKVPEFVYFVGQSEWIMGPYVNKPRHRNDVRKFRLEEVKEITNDKKDKNERL